MGQNVSTDPLLTIRNLSHSLGQGTLKSQVLFDINLEIYAGEIAIMTGPSGSGKTTLLTLIGGLRTIQTGSVRLLGQELSGASQRQLVKSRRQVGYIFQAHNLLPFLTARQNVQLSFELHPNVSARVAKQKAEAMLTYVGLGDRIDHHPQQLSGGQKQRVAIARALVTPSKGHPRRRTHRRPRQQNRTRSRRYYENPCQRSSDRNSSSYPRQSNFRHRRSHHQNGRWLAAIVLPL